MGAPGDRKVDIDQLAALCRLKPTLIDCAAFFKCNESTIQRIIKEHTGLSFAQFREQNMVHTRHDLIRKAIQMATSGNTPMLIFSLKNLCGWSDRTVNIDNPEENYETPETLKLDEETSETN